MNSNIIIAIAVVAGVFLGWFIRKLIERQESLEKQVSELSDIANRRKLPYPAQAGLEDAISIVIDVLNENKALTAYNEARENQLYEILKVLRSDPQHYDINQPDRPSKGE